MKEEYIIRDQSKAHFITATIVKSTNERAYKQWNLSKGKLCGAGIFENRESKK